MALPTPEAQQLNKLFGSRLPISVPRYQRTFSWDDAQIDQFCSDIREHVASNPRIKYFFGSVLAIMRHEETYEIIDGQQRCTAFMLLLAQMRNAYDLIASTPSPIAQQAHAAAEAIERQYIRIPLGDPRLTLSRMDEDYFKNLMRRPSVVEIPGKKSHALLKSSFEDLHTKLIHPLALGATTPELRYENLKRLDDAFLRDCFVIFTVCGDQDDGFRLFEILNDRGKDLATCDYLRNWTLNSLREHLAEQERAAQVWDLVAQSPDTKNFLNAYQKSFEGPIKQRMLHWEIRAKRELGGDVNSARDATALVEKIKDIQIALNRYSQLRNGTWPWEPDESEEDAWARASLELLATRIRTSVHLPLLMAARQVLNEREFLEIVLMLNRTILRYTHICGQPANRLDAICNRFIRRIRGKPDSGSEDTIPFRMDALRSDLNELIRDLAPDVVLEEKVKGLNYSEHRNEIKCLLSTLDYYSRWHDDGAQGKPIPTTAVVHNFDALELDHIYPKKPRVAHKIVAMEPEAVKHNIGNIALLLDVDNRRLRNKPFADKTATYLENRIRMTTNLGNLPDWDIAAFRIRRDSIAAMAKKILVA